MKYFEHYPYSVVNTNLHNHDSVNIDLTKNCDKIIIGGCKEEECMGQEGVVVELNPYFPH